jgi:hypothetical protein
MYFSQILMVLVFFYFLFQFKKVGEVSFTKTKILIISTLSDMLITHTYFTKIEKHPIKDILTD